MLIFFKLPTVRESLKRVPRQSLKERHGATNHANRANVPIGTEDPFAQIRVIRRFRRGGSLPRNDTQKCRGAGGFSAFLHFGPGTAVPACTNSRGPVSAHEKTPCPQAARSAAGRWRSGGCRPGRCRSPRWTRHRPPAVPGRAGLCVTDGRRATTRD